MKKRDILVWVTIIIAIIIMVVIFILNSRSDHTNLDDEVNTFELKLDQNDTYDASRYNRGIPFYFYLHSKSY